MRKAIGVIEERLGCAQSFQKSLNRSGASAVYRTVDAIDLANGVAGCGRRY